MIPNSLLFILFILVIAIPIVVLTLLKQREEKRTILATRALEAVTSAHGLQTEVSTNPLVVRRVAGKHSGVKWALEIRRPMTARISYPPPFLLWTAEALKTGGDTVLVARSSALPPKMETSGVLSSFALHDVTLPSLFGPTLGMLDENYRLLAKIGTGNDGLKAQFLILATSEEAAHAFLTPAREQALLAWAATNDPAQQRTYIVQWRTALHVMIDGALDRATVEGVVELGDKLLSG
jgi:hypothetical protein